MAALNTSPRRLALAFVVLATLAGLSILLVSSAVGQGEDREALLLGKTKRTQRPAPDTAIATVTGFQTRLPGANNPFAAPRDGKIVAWAAALGKTEKDLRREFNDAFPSEAFGKGVLARISILKKRSKGRFKLTRQSPPVKLKNFGGRTTVTLTDPLRIRKGEIVAITVPTWLPNLIPLGKADPASRWRASRAKGSCGKEAAEDARPHQREGSTRPYGCIFGDRLAYWAHFVGKR